MKYQISGTFKNTGTDVTIIVEAENSQIAESVAFKKGILISKVEQYSKESSSRFPLWAIIIGIIVCLASIAIIAIISTEVKEARVKAKEEKRVLAEARQARIQLRQQEEQEEANRYEALLEDGNKAVANLKESMASINRALDERIAWEEEKRAQAGGITTDSKWSGFRGLKWGVNIRNVPNMILIEEDKKAETTAYGRADDKLFIGRAELSGLTYYYYKGCFYGIFIKTDGLSNFQYLKDAIFAYYGEGYQPNEYIKQWCWGGAYSKGVKGVRMWLEYNEFSEKGTLLMNYTPIQKEKEADDDAKAKEADKDFK